MNEINHDDVETFIELRGVYDGWSIAKMKDGSYINRWPEEDRRFKQTERVAKWLARVDEIHSKGEELVQFV